MGGDGFARVSEVVLVEWFSHTGRPAVDWIFCCGFCEIDLEYTGDETGSTQFIRSRVTSNKEGKCI